MKIAFIWFSLFTLTMISCTPKVYPLKGTYTNGNFEQYSDKSKDKVWDNIIDFFAKNGISIKIIDRSSGLIISGETSLTWSFENNKGQLEKKDAWVAIYRMYDPGSRLTYKPYLVTGEWNIRIKEQNEKTLININLVNPSYTLTITSPNKTSFQKGYLQSTGNFEKWVYENIK
jgi:hypothetical protein